MPDQSQLTNGDKPNFYSLYLMVGEMKADIKTMKEGLQGVCKIAQDADDRVKAVQNKAIGLSVGIAFLINVIGFLTDWFGLRQK